jgi:hypothetical protein
MADNSYEYIKSREKFEDTNTIETTIQSNKDFANDYTKSAILTRLTNNGDTDIIDVPYDNALYMYLDEMKSASKTITLSNSEYERYEYRPDLLSYDMYGTTEYYYVLLALNDIISPKHFTKKKIKVIEPEYITTLISLIADSESEYINLNRSIYTEKQ